MKKRYINMKHNGQTETVDEFPYNTIEDMKYFKEMLNEYRISDRSSTYYGSQRACKDWND